MTNSQPLPRCNTCTRESADLVEKSDNDGIYCGRYCSEACWRASGYIAATDPNHRFDPLDAGESLEPEDY